MPTACVPKVLHFSGFQNGQYSYGPLDDYCVSIAFAKAGANGQRRGYTPINNIHQPAGGPARIYDTGDGENCDVDLFTPSPKFFGGPEFVGPVSCSECCGGAPFESVYDTNAANDCREMVPQTTNPNINDVYLGNVLIIQEKGDNNEPDSCPDDSNVGGTITFDFCEPVSFQSLQLLDIDEGDELELYYSDGRPVKTIAFPNTGDNGVATEVYFESNCHPFENKDFNILRYLESFLLYASNDTITSVACTCSISTNHPGRKHTSPWTYPTQSTWRLALPTMPLLNSSQRKGTMKQWIGGPWVCLFLK